MRGVQVQGCVRVQVHGYVCVSMCMCSATPACVQPLPAAAARAWFSPGLSAFYRFSCAPITIPCPLTPPCHCPHAARRFCRAFLRRIAELAAFLSFLLPGLRRCLEAARSACPPRANPIRWARSACFRASLSIFSV